MEFTTLKSYTNWRTDKRIEYKNLSHKIRLLKNEINATFKNGGYAGNMQASLLGLKDDATTIMEERRQAKQIAKDSWTNWKTNEAKMAA